MGQRSAGRPRQDESDQDLIARLGEQFPSLLEASPWAAALDNPHFHAAVVTDVVKVAVPRGPDKQRGIRPLPEADAVQSVLDEINGTSYSMESFVDALHELTGRHSLSGVAARTGINRYTVHRLRRGESKPSMAEMEKIATAYHRSPLYFVEYRTGWLLSLVAASLTPERSAALVEQIRRER